MKKKIAIIGFDGYATDLLDAIRTSDEWHLSCVIGTPYDRGEPPDGIKANKKIKDISSIVASNPELTFICGIGENLRSRRTLIESLKSLEKKWAIVIHPSATVATSAKIAYGSTVLPKAVVQSNARISNHCIIGARCMFGRGSFFGSFSSLGAGAIVGTNSIVGEGAEIRLGAKINGNLHIGANVTVEPGSMVVSEIADEMTVSGNPAKPLSFDISIPEISHIFISLQASLRKAMELIDKYGTMMVMVTDSSSKLLGVVTDGDVRRALLKYTSLDVKVEKIMNKNFKFVRDDISRVAALDIMKALGVNQIPILDKHDKAIGLHTYSSLVASSGLPNAVLIMAGGKGKRLRPITENIPKPMVTVAGRPILEHIILHLVGHGISNIYIAVNYLGTIIEDYFEDGSAFACKIRYLRENRPLGTAGAIALLPEKPVHPLVVMNGDLITQFDAKQMIAHHKNMKNDISIGVHNYSHQIPYGVIKASDSSVEDIIEKPVQYSLINGGIYVISPNIVSKITEKKKIDMTEMIGKCISEGYHVGMHLLEGDWIDVGRHSELASARGL